MPNQSYLCAPALLDIVRAVDDGLLALPLVVHGVCDGIHDAISGGAVRGARRVVGARGVAKRNLALAAVCSTARPPHGFVGFDRVGDIGKLCLLIGAFGAAHQLIGTGD